MKKLILGILFLLSSNSLLAVKGLQQIELIDIDLDGKPDKVTMAIQASEIPIGFAPVNIQIDFTSDSSQFNYKTHSSILVDNLLLTSWYDRPGFISLTYTTTTGDAPEYYAEIYKWEPIRQKLCLYYRDYSRLSNREMGLRFDLIRSIEFHNGCTELGDILTGNVPDPDELDMEFWKKNKDKISVEILEKKAALFNSPQRFNKSKMYLVNGDWVIIKDYQRIDEIDWFLVEYSPSIGKKPVVRWLMGKSLGLGWSK
jgi:hypothetical protein